MSRIDDTKPFIPVRIAVLTVSDTRGLAEDRSGDTLVQRIQDAGHILAGRMILPDERDQIAAQLFRCDEPSRIVGRAVDTFGS